MPVGSALTTSEASEQPGTSTGVDAGGEPAVVDPDVLPGRGRAFVRSALPWVTLLLSRAIRLVVVLLLVSLATLALLDLLPGGPADAILGPSATDEQVQALNANLGLDDPFLERYVDWVHGIATGDLGRSVFTSQSVSDIITTRLPVTLELAIGTLFVALVLALPSAVYAAAHPGGWFDRVVGVVGSGFIAIPGFILGVLLIYLLGVQFQVFPVLGWVPLTDDLWQNLDHAFLPVMSLALYEAAVFTRVLRNDMVATLHEDYILAARARGLPRRRILFGHALKPSCFSLVTIAGVSLGRLIGGTVIVETLFVLPGLGQAAIQAIGTRDFTLLRGVIVVVSIGYVLVNTLVDLTYHLLDPRVRSVGSR
jgi:peptide/nickel transport system permease protein